jgi:hypothetical protein
MNSPAPIGHNNPPTTPYEMHEHAISSLYDEAVHWLDGEPIDSEATAEGVATLMREIRKAGKAADTARKEEKAPHATAVKEIDTRWKAVTTLATLAANAAKEALAPWLIKKEAEKAEADRKAREQADRQMAEAQKALQDSDVTNLSDRAEAEAKYQDAKKADAIATKDANKSSGVGGAGGRKVALRTTWVVTLIDPTAALEHFWPHEGIEAVLIRLAQAEARDGKRTIPGFNIEEKKETV